MNQPVKCAVIPVGGLGTRFLPATKAVPKEMLPVVDKPLIQYAVEEAITAGIERIVMVTSRGKGAIEDHFDHAVELERTLAESGKTDLLDLVEGGGMPPGDIVFTRQQQPLGLGHAVWCARHLVGNQPFAVILPDDMVLADTPCLEQMVKAYRSSGGNLAAVMDVPLDQISRYGILDVEADDGRMVAVKGLVEKPAPEDAPSSLAIIGRYVLQPEVFAKLEAQEPGAGGEIQLTDAMARLIGEQPFYGFRFDGTRYDCGDKIGFLEASLAYALARDDLNVATRYMLRHLMNSL